MHQVNDKLSYEIICIKRCQKQEMMIDIREKKKLRDIVKYKYFRNV